MNSIKLTLAPPLSLLDRGEAHKHTMSWPARTTFLRVVTPVTLLQPGLAKFVLPAYLLAELWYIARDLLDWWLRGREERIRLECAVVKERLTHDNWGEFLDRLDYLARRPRWNPFRYK